jgi:hypothetical protein
MKSGTQIGKQSFGLRTSVQRILIAWRKTDKSDLGPTKGRGLPLNPTLQSSVCRERESKPFGLLKPHFHSQESVRSTQMGRPNRSQITKQAGFKQTLLRVCSLVRFTVPKEQGQRSHA